MNITETLAHTSGETVVNNHRRSGLAAGGAALLAVSLLVTGAAGCSGGKKKGRSSSSSSKHDGPDAVTTAGTNGGVTFSASPAATRTSSATPGTRCRAADLTAAVQVQAAGSALVTLTNKGRNECTVNGYPVLGGRLADNSEARTPLRKEPHPGAPTRITLKPNTTGFAGLAWKPCAKSEPNCTVLATLVVTPPDESAPLVAQVTGLDGKPVAQLPVSAAGFTVGSLQPASQGVLFPASR